MVFLKNKLCHSIILIFIVSCSSGGSVGNLTNDNQSISIYVNGLVSPSESYAKQTVEISTDNSMCSFNIALKDNNKKIHHVNSNDNKTFSFRNPIVYRNSENHYLVISTNFSNTCPQASKEINLEVLKSSTKYNLIPENVENLKTNIYNKKIGQSVYGNTNTVYVDPLNSLRFVLNKLQKDKITLNQNFYVFTGSSVGVVPILRKGIYKGVIDKIGRVSAKIS